MHRVHYSCILADGNNTTEKELDIAETGGTTGVDTGERAEKWAFQDLVTKGRLLGQTWVRGQRSGLFRI